MISGAVASKLSTLPQGLNRAHAFGRRQARVRKQKRRVDRQRRGIAPERNLGSHGLGSTGWPCGGRGVIDGPLTEKYLPTKSM